METKTTIVAILFLLFITSAFPQPNIKQQLKQNVPGIALFTVAGASNAITEVLRHDYASFKRTFPTANDNFWNPNLSWKNKYKNGDPKQGEAFFGSTTAFVGATDGYHLTRTINNICIVAAIAIKIGEKKRKWYEYAIDAGTYAVAYSIGFNVTYELIRK